MAETPPTLSKQIIPQVLRGLIVAMTTVPSGMNMGFPSVALTPLASNATVDHLNEEEASWFASISSIATPIGCLLCGPLLDKFGRRVGLLVLAPWFTAGWLLLVLCPTQPMYLYLGRVVAGLATGFASVPGAICLGEVSSHAIRGMLVVWPSVSISLGIFIIYVLGALMKDSWKAVALISSSFPLVTALLTYLFVPETPVWLLTKGKVLEAEISFKKFRNVKESDDLPNDLKIEFQAMKEKPNKYVCEKVTLKSQVTGVSPAPAAECFTTCRDTLASLLLPQAWKPLVILNTYFFFQQFSGIYVVVSYAVDMIELAGVVVDAYTAAVVLAAVQLLTGIVVSFFLTRCGRRPLSIASGAGMTICMFTLAVYLHITGICGDTSKLAWIPLTALSLYVLSNAMGFHTLPWAMIGEIYPARISGLAGGITTFMAYLFNFFALKTYPMLKVYMGAGGVFYLYGSVSLLGTIFVAVFLPETHRKSLFDVEEMFRSQRCVFLPCTSKKRPKIVPSL